MRLVRTVLGIGLFGARRDRRRRPVGRAGTLVFDDNGMPLPGATVTLVTRGLHQDQRPGPTPGQVDFPVLHAGGGYWVEVSFPGFDDEAGTDQGRLSTNETIKIQLLPEMQERVKVTAERDVIDLESTETSTKFSDEFIPDLPVPGPLLPERADPGARASRTRTATATQRPRLALRATSRRGRRREQRRSADRPVDEPRQSRTRSRRWRSSPPAPASSSAARRAASPHRAEAGSNEHEGVFEFYYRSSKLDGTGASDDIEPARPGLRLVTSPRAVLRSDHEGQAVVPRCPTSCATSRSPINVGSGTRRADDRARHARRPDHLAGLAAQQAGVPVPGRPVQGHELRRQLAAAAPSRPSARAQRVETYIADLDRAVLAQGAGRERGRLAGPEHRPVPQHDGRAERLRASASRSSSSAQCFDAETGEVSGSYNQFVRRPPPAPDDAAAMRRSTAGGSGA